MDLFSDKVLADLVAKIRTLEAQIEARIAERRAQFHYSVEQNKVRFEQGIKARQRPFKLGVWQQIRQSSLSIILVSPVIYSLIFPLALLDLFVVIYQAVCFPLYNIEKVPRKAFFVVDHHHLAYLNPLEKINCLYCGYGNSVLNFAREIASLTEQYWCPIKHSRPMASPHSRYSLFVDYGDAEGYRKRQQKLRDHLTPPDTNGS
jgi:hypothetical protein